ncbi:hypothetical protein [Streptomyces capparidis]
MAALIARAQAAAGAGRPGVQREEAGPPTGRGALDDGYDRARREARWQDAAVALEGFSDIDVRERISPARLPLAERAHLRAAVPESAHRVRGALIVLAYREAVARGDWASAVVEINGLNDEGIREHAAQLAPEHVPLCVRAALENLTGVSRNRVVAGLRDRYERTSDEPVGTRTLGVVQLMQASGLDAATALAYVRLRLGVTTTTSPDDKPGDPVQVLGAAMGAVAAAPKGKQPPALQRGNLAHLLIGGVYMARNPLSFYDLPAVDFLNRLATKYRRAKARNDLLVNIDMRPDIVDLPRMEIFEIKPLGSAGLAVAEMKDYVELLNGLVKEEHAGFRPGNPGNPGTTGVLPYADQGQDGILVWGAPYPGAILYTVMNPQTDGSAEHVRERIHSGDLVGGGLMSGAGVEVMTGATLVVTLAAVETFPSLIAALSRALPLAEQPAPALGLGGRLVPAAP